MTMACRIPSRRARRRLVLPVSRFTLATERDRRDTHRALDNGLRDLRRGARWRRGRALEVQPLVQIVRPANYAVFKGPLAARVARHGVQRGRLAEEAAR
jgi:hypothetical protein